MDVGRDTTVCTHDQSKPTVDTIFEANGKPGAAHKQAAWRLPQNNNNEIKYSRRQIHQIGGHQWSQEEQRNVAQKDTQG